MCSLISCIRQRRAHLIWLGCVFIFILFSLGLYAGPSILKNEFFLCSSLSFGSLDFEPQEHWYRVWLNKTKWRFIKTLEPRKLIKASKISGLGPHSFGRICIDSVFMTQDHLDHGTIKGTAILRLVQCGKPTVAQQIPSATKTIPEEVHVLKRNLFTIFFPNIYWVS